MKNHRRILVTLPDDARADALLRQASQDAVQGASKLLALKVLDTRSGFEPDGPAAVFTSERLARQLPAARAVLKRQMERHNLAWAETRVVCDEPGLAISACVRDWRPDLVIDCADFLSDDNRFEGDDPPDVLHVACHGLWHRLGEGFNHLVGHGTHKPA